MSKSKLRTLEKGKTRPIGGSNDKDAVGRTSDCWTVIMTEDFEGFFPSGSWSAFDNDGSINGEYYWDDDDYLPHNGSWSA
ncbi:MAG: hypothetical protein ACE5NG_17695, partial [bacterium]